MKLVIAALCGSLALAACGTVDSPCDKQCTVTKAYVTSESSVTIAAKGISKAVDLGAIKPGSDIAKALKLTLDGADKALDAANAYIAAGLFDQAQNRIDSANTSVSDVNTQTGTAP